TNRSFQRQSERLHRKDSRVKRILLAECGKNRESFEEPEGDAGKIAGKEQYARHDQEATHDFFDHTEMLLEALEEGEEGTNGDASEEERDAEAERIKAQQLSAFPGGIATSRDRENGRKHRADAGRPAHSKGETEQKSTQWARCHARPVVAELAVKKADTEDAEEVQAHGDDDEAGDGRDDRQELPEHLPEGSRGGTHGDEHHREAHDEE